MAIRYSGDVTVRLAWDDQAEAYRGTVAVVECAAPASGDHGRRRRDRWNGWRIGLDGRRVESVQS